MRITQFLVLLGLRILPVVLSEPNVFAEYFDDGIKLVDISQDTALRSCLADGKTADETQKVYNECFGTNYNFNDLAEAGDADTNSDGLPDEFNGKEECFYKKMGWVSEENQLDANKIGADMEGLEEDIKNSFNDNVAKCTEWDGNFGGARMKRSIGDGDGVEMIENSLSLETVPSIMQSGRKALGWVKSLMRRKRDAKKGNDNGVKGKGGGKKKKKNNKNKRKKGGKNNKKKKKNKRKNGKVRNKKGGKKGVNKNKKRKSRGKKVGHKSKKGKKGGKAVRKRSKNSKKRPNGKKKRTKGAKGKGGRRNKLKGNKAGNKKHKGKGRRRNKGGNKKRKGSRKLKANKGGKKKPKGSKKRNGQKKSKNKGKGPGRKKKNGKGKKRSKNKGKNGKGKPGGKKKRKSSKNGKRKKGGKKGKGERNGKSLPVPVYNQLWCIDLSVEQALEKCVEEKIKN